MMTWEESMEDFLERHQRKPPPPPPPAPAPPAHKGGAQ
jgi:hypothetical protein